jgi:recombination associated protein RdgC
LVDDFNEIRQLDEEYEQQDASLTLLSGELRALMTDLLADMTEKTPDLVASPALQPVAESAPF